MAGSAPDSTDYSISLADCTSPSQLQEVTLDQDATFSNTMGLRSPNGPLRGRSVKEFEDQLSNLKKENFNLKLRIYFLEEKMGTNFTLDKDNVVKKNIELQVQIANLQQEVKEKHELLCQAVKALDLEDEEHKKYAQTKEEHMSQLQQELEDLRLQLHETKFDGDNFSPKSTATSIHSDKNNEIVAELQEKLRIVEYELQLERDNNASVNVIIAQAQTLKTRYEHMQKESQAKDETINRLNEELKSSNQRLVDFAEQVKDYEEKLASSHQDNQNLLKKMQSESRKVEEAYSQLNELNKKYSVTKYELEREYKRAERTKLITEAKLEELEMENEKLKAELRNVHGKLDAALVESKKNQNLAVAESPMQKPTTPNTQHDSLSVTDPTTPDGVEEKNALHVQVAEGSAPGSPERLGAGEPDRILSEYQTLKGEHGTLKRKIVKLRGEQLKACEIIKTMIQSQNKDREEIARLRRKNERLEKEMEMVVTKPMKDEVSTISARVSQLNLKAVGGDDGRADVQEHSFAKGHTQGVDIAEHYEALTAALESKIEVLMATLEEKDSQMQKVHDQYEEVVNILEEKENRIVDLEFEILSVNQMGGKIDKSLLETNAMTPEKRSSTFYKQEIEEKNKQIEKLNVELKKCTCYLQEIVNKELWEKNREIEKMHKKQENDTDITRLKKELTGKDLQLRLLKEKISELGVEISLPLDELASPTKNIQHIKTLQEQLGRYKDENKRLEDELVQIKDNNVVKQLKFDLEKSEKLRMETNEVCSVLSGRLEELAVFLDSLLKQKSVLGFLGIAKNKRLREIINSSLDMSRSFSMSLTINPDQSLMQLTNITALLNGSIMQELSLQDITTGEQEEDEINLSIVPENVSLTYERHLCKKNDENAPDSERVIAALRDQVFKLKSELQLRDNELNRMQSKGYCERMPEDGEKQVSKLFSSNKSNTSTTLKYHSDNYSESEAWSEPDRVVSKARIGLNHTAPASLKHSQTALYESTEEESSVSITPSRKRQSVIDLHQQLCDLEKEVERKTQELNSIDNKFNEQYVEELEKKLAEAELKRTETEEKMKDLQSIVEELTKTKEEMEKTVQNKNKEIQNKVNELELARNEALKEAKDFEKQATNAKNEVTSLEEQIKSANNEMQRLKIEYETKNKCLLENAKLDFEMKLQSIQERTDLEIAMAKEEIKTLHDEYARDYVRKSEVETKLIEVQRLGKELEDLKNTVCSYEETIESYRKQEREVKNSVQEYQDKINVLRKELDNTTLQYSETVLEKTKLANEKANLEQELNRFNMKESELKRQFSEIQSELSSVTDNYHQQVAHLQKQRSKLEVKISELESANAELRNRLIRLQSQSDLNSSMPNMPLIAYRRQCSDQTLSSEENGEETKSFLFNRPLVNVRPVDEERHEQNSSPDLGIDSDHGRFSSLETQTNVPRPLLQTLELTESMSNLLDVENNQIEGNSHGHENCCQRTLMIVQENNELKRKLLRMKRALEETASQLNLANQRKKQVEKTICKQIHKTSQVLRKAKANLDSGSESDVFNM